MHYSIGDTEAVVEEIKIKEPGKPEVLPGAFRRGRKLYPEELEYVKQVFKDSVDYDKVRITRDHWFSTGSTRVVGNTIHFTTDGGYDYHFLPGPGDRLSQEGMNTLAHEMAHIWQFQNGGWAYAVEALAKQAAGAYATGSRNTAYDWKTAVEWEVPWSKWGPEQQATAIEEWGLALRSGNKEMLDEIAPYMEKVWKGEGAPQISPIGIAIFGTVGAGLGYLLNKKNRKRGALLGAGAGVLINLPWNKWRKDRAS